MVTDTPLSNYDLRDFIQEANINDPNIIQSNDLSRTQHIFDDRGHAIIFHKFNKKDNIGHWIPIVRTNNGKDAIVMCSFGTQLEEIDGLREALERDGIQRVYVNDKRYQNYDSSACGRYSLFVIGCNKLGVGVEGMQKLLEIGKKKYGSYDKFILSLFD